MRRHILFIVENHAVPFDKRVWKEALAARSWGYEVSVICPKEDHSPSSHEKIEDIDIYRHPMPADSPKKTAYLIEYLTALFWEFWLSIRLYRKKPFQIIHAANPPDTIFLIAIFFRLFRVKFVFDVHDLSPELYKSRFGKESGLIYKMLVLVEKYSSKIADAIITTNHSYAEILLERHKTNPRKMFIVRNDPMVREFQNTDFTPRHDKKGMLLYLGSVNPQDGVEGLMNIVHHLVYELNEKNIICVVVGDGQTLPSVKNIVKSMNLNDYVDTKGFIYDRKVIYEYLHLADVCVEPAPDSDINRHSTFIKIMEYMASGKPIVAYDLKENRYSAGESALFVKPGDIKGFALAIRDLLHDPARRQQLGQSGEERINNTLNWGRSLENLKKAYESIQVISG